MTQPKPDPNGLTPGGRTRRAVRMLIWTWCLCPLWSNAAEVIGGHLEPCLIGVQEKRVITIAVVNEGAESEHAMLYHHDGSKYLRGPEDGYSAHQTAFALSAGGRFPSNPKYRWPLDSLCEFAYKAPHPVHVYVYKIDPRRDLQMHPSWFEIEFERNGLAVLAQEIDEYEKNNDAELEITWLKRGSISY